MVKIPKIIKVLIILFIFLFLLDVIFTYSAVQKLQIAYETNHFLTFLWQHFGFFGGEAIHFGIFLVGISVLLLISQSKIGAVISFTCLLLLNSLWLIAVVSNFLILVGK